MATKKFTKMETASADDLIFGEAKYPVSYGLGMKVGAGTVYPEVNFAPRPGAEKNPESLTREYVDYIATDIMNRAVTLGFPGVQLENEWIHQMGNDPKKFAKPVVVGQKAVLQKFHDEYGIATAIRHTCADPRLAEEGLRYGMDKHHMYPEKTLDSFEVAAANGADVLSVETMGGKEITDYAVVRQDIKGWLFGGGYLGPLDMEWIWPQIVDVAKKNKVIAGGDTYCASANTSMFMAGGYLDKDLPRTQAAVTRAIAASRTLVAIECGATGPDKDCGYEGPILKAISGRPSAQEGKGAQDAHADLMGNLIAQTADLWSNESVEYHPEFGGSSVQCWLGVIGYEAALMNAAKQLKQDKILRDIYVASDRFRSPEAFILAYDNAYKIGQAIVSEGNSYYLRSKAAGLKAAELIKASNDAGKLKLSRQEKDTLNKILTDLKSLPDEEGKFVDWALKEYKNVPAFNPKNYEL
ncbi:methanol--corrinoid protein co-methyltransferase MtaB [Methanomassiliicoccus luminyensis]|jgi:methanol--5-hydroxybenzimidazolylcobamide Co-methyltransferase|uniref:methanol--corrinoid protein co-methyltransferase MtaB n=1 Tax=Methanomassiliicoccus luminyensis TaxID=1080712 RepID=UPI0003662D25|nr:methanol--corrinoid protein co-methyltransferase MtaB [Methanomassiliicoccus luminyensis]